MVIILRSFGLELNLTPEAIDLAFNEIKGLLGERLLRVGSCFGVICRY